MTDRELMSMAKEASMNAYIPYSRFAVGAAIEGHTGGFIESILKDIALAIGDEKDDFKASCLNVQHGVETIRHELEIHPVHDPKGLEVAGAIYHIEDGRVELL